MSRAVGIDGGATVDALEADTLRRFRRMLGGTLAARAALAEVCGRLARVIEGGSIAFKSTEMFVRYVRSTARRTALEVARVDAPCPRRSPLVEEDAKAAWEAAERQSRDLRLHETSPEDLLEAQVRAARSRELLNSVFARLSTIDQEQLRTLQVLAEEAHDARSPRQRQAARRACRRARDVLRELGFASFADAAER